ncbi:hypothetical protein ACFQ6N_39435 [Kitasatospora sp. NPDC056446]|uniref:hypothetical protein n=1 Tax=Kitasatospora sp. NPDC056446 TaxID=3345819 RepID=UPI00369E7987
MHTEAWDAGVTLLGALTRHPAPAAHDGAEVVRQFLVQLPIAAGDDLPAGGPLDSVGGPLHVAAGRNTPARMRVASAARIDVS